MTARLIWFGVVGVILGTSFVQACSICGGGITSRLTLREQLQRADFVAVGRLQNPQFDPNGGSGQTEFRIETLLKSPVKGPRSGVIIVPRYIPIIGDTPPDYLLCCLTEGTLEPIFGKASTKALSTYAQQLLKLDERDSPARLKFAFSQLDSADEAVAADAFLEFAKAPDTEILQANSVLQPAKLRRLLNDPKTPSERLGVFALLLGLCGTTTDAENLASLLSRPILPETVRANLGGYLAGLTLLDSSTGWKQIQKVLVSESESLDQRLAAISAVRFFQATRPQVSREAILACYRRVLALPELADIVIDDLRRWQWWDLSEEIFKLYGLPLYEAMTVKRGIIRYALQCPGNEANRFLAAVREQDLKLVQDVEELLKAFEPIKP